MKLKMILEEQIDPPKGESRGHISQALLLTTSLNEMKLRDDLASTPPPYHDNSGCIRFRASNISLITLDLLSLALEYKSMFFVEMGPKKYKPDLTLAAQSPYIIITLFTCTC